MKSKKKKPFDINAMTLSKLGWKESEESLWRIQSSPRRKIPEGSIYHFFGEAKTYYISEKGKGDEIRYFFCIAENGGISSKRRICSNAELFKAIMEEEACEESYARHFRINKLFKNG